MLFKVNAALSCLGLGFQLLLVEKRYMGEVKYGLLILCNRPYKILLTFRDLPFSAWQLLH
jgi:hypothetical protein